MKLIVDQECVCQLRSICQTANNRLRWTSQTRSAFLDSTSSSDKQSRTESAGCRSTVPICLRRRIPTMDRRTLFLEQPPNKPCRPSCNSLATWEWRWRDSRCSFCDIVSWRCSTFHKSLNSDSSTLDRVSPTHKCTVDRYQQHPNLRCIFCV